MRVVVLHNSIAPDAGNDELDTLVQVEQVCNSLTRLGYQPEVVAFSFAIDEVTTTLKKINPQFVFNLVEAIEGVGRWLHLSAMLLEHLKIPFTGSSSRGLFLTTDKLLTKSLLLSADLPTPEFLSSAVSLTKAAYLKHPYIIKPIAEDASIGIAEDAVVFATSAEEILEQIKNHSQRYQVECFAERYIDGREFNISVLANKSEMEVLSAAEVNFRNFPKDKLRIVDYRAKWDRDSFEYKNTEPKFDFPPTDQGLLKQINEITSRSIQVCELSGYARVDFRVDADNQPWVLEVNANPCLSPDGGFVAAAQHSGLDLDLVISRIVEAVGEQQF